MSTLDLPADHPARLARAQRCLDGLSVGDAFCAQFFLGEVYERHFAARTLPAGSWRYTDDTAMAQSIVEVLAQHGKIDQDALAAAFAVSYAADPNRGYGPSVYKTLLAIGRGEPWRQVSHAAHGGAGSMGNGSPMRVAPIGAYFADDLERAAHEAALSAEVTHAHPEGLAGAVAVAVATALAFQPRPLADGDLLRVAITRTPAGKTRDGLQVALGLVRSTPIAEVARILGRGERVLVIDTVPLALWLADRYRGDFTEALWAVVTAGGDVDTLGAMVGGILADHAAASLPAAWLVAREPLRLQVPE